MRSLGDQLEQMLADWGSGDGPLYRRLANGIESLARVGALAYGERLPSERDLAARLHVSRNTVKAAYGLLRDKGWLDSERGSAPRLHHPSRGVAGARGDSWLGEMFPGAIAMDLRSLAPAPAPVVERALRDPESYVGPIRLEGSGYLPDGHPELREQVAALLRREGVAGAAPERVVITNGGQHAHSLLVGALASRSRPAAVEELTFPGVFDPLERVHAPVIALPFAGGRLDAVASAAVIRATRPAFALLTTFQHPTGTCLTEDDALVLVAVARDAGTVLVENRCSAALALTGDSPPPLAALTDAAQVATIGSLTKVFWAGLRVGWIYANATLAAHLRRRRMAIDFGSSPLGQRLGAALLRDHLDATVAWRRERLEAAVDAALAELAAVAPEWEVARPAGGPAVWVGTPGVDVDRLALRAARMGSPITPGSAFEARAGAGAHHLRIACWAEPPEIREGIRRVAAAG